MRIMHFADAHLGIETYGRLDPATGLNTRLLDVRRSLDCAIGKALDAGVHLALFGGDAYKSRDPSQTHQREFAGCIRRLTDAGVPVVMLTGNHDLPNAKGRANAVEIYRTLGVRGVHVISHPEVVRVETSAGPVQVAGMPYLLRSKILSREACKGKSLQETTDIMVKFYHDYINKDLAGALDSSLPSVLLGHFWIRNAKVSSQAGYLNVAEPEVLVSTVANPAFDYVAMGHIHKHQDLNKRGMPPVVYCGSIDRIDFSERNEEKGFVLVELTKGSASYEFVRVDARRFVAIDVDADVEDPTARILAAIAEAEVADAVVKLVYHIGRDRLPLVREQEIRAALAPAHLVVSVTKDVARDSRTARNRLLTEGIDPLKALEMFCQTHDTFRKRAPDLLDYARPLVDELMAEEGGLAE